MAAVENEEKLRLLGASARFDVSAPSTIAAQDALSGRPGGIYEALSADGRRVPLLKVLLSNACKNDCLYCATRCSRNIPRASFQPQELARLTVELAEAGLIKGLFLSSGIVGDSDSTMARMIEAVEILRHQYHFRDYVHLKILPGTSDAAIARAAGLADRLSVNLEAPSSRQLQTICPGKNFRRGLLGTLRRVTPLENHPATPPAREHRLYQAEFLLRSYGFEPGELVFDDNDMLPLDQDPKLAAALARPDFFPVEINRAERWELIRVPGIGPTSAERIVAARTEGKITSLRHLAMLGVLTERARNFVTLNGHFYPTPAAPRQLAFEL